MLREIFFGLIAKCFLENQALFADRVTARVYIDSVENVI